MKNPLIPRLSRRRIVAMSIVLGSLFLVSPAAAADQSFVCEVSMFSNFINLAIEAIMYGFFPVLVAALLGERFANALPLSQQRRQKLMEWRGKALGAAAMIYIGLPIGIEFARQVGLPVADCITYIPWG